MMFPAVHLIPLGLGLVIAAIWDVRARKVPNVLSLAVAVAGIGVRFWNLGPLSALFGVMAALLTVALLYRFWLARGIGGGDVKLAAAVGVWIGFERLIPYALAGALAGGLIAAACYFRSDGAARREIRANLTIAALQQRLPTVAFAGAGRLSVPYALAVAVGGTVALGWSW